MLHEHESRQPPTNLLVINHLTYRSNLASSFNICRVPPFHALRATFAFPLTDLGPVDFSHGRHRLISSACRARRSAVHPFAMLLLQ